MKPKLSLKGRGLQLLAQREHSRSEMQRKLLAHAQAEVLAQADAVRAVVGVDSAGHGAAHRPLAGGAAECGDEFAAALAAASLADESAADSADLRRVATVRVNEVLDWLVSQGHLSESRFIESRVHVRAARYGAQRIRLELAQHGLSLSPEETQGLRSTEVRRAREVWQRKFGAPPANTTERARHMRFLAGRGFSGETIRRVLQAGDDPGDAS